MNTEEIEWQITSTTGFTEYKAFLKGVRIGNLFYSANENWVPKRIVSSITQWDFTREHPRNFSPIPLDEEWLKKFGWQYLNGQTSGEMTKDTDCKLDIDWIENGIQVKSHYENGSMYRHLPIQYVHQLQNLFFALTGTELELKYQ